MKKWNEFPDFIKCSEVKGYYDLLSKKKFGLWMKRFFDFVVALLLLFILAIPMIIIAILLKLDSKGPVFYRQERVTAYGKKFRIHKFRTMVNDADKVGSKVTVSEDVRITRIGRSLRRWRLDEIPQIFDVLVGNMSFVGTRPEVEKYVLQYTNEMKATLLLPAGITSDASIRFKDEAELLKNVEDIDQVYVEKILPAKMYYNLKAIKEFSFWSDIKIMFMTVLAVFGKEYKELYIVKTTEENQMENVK